MLHPASGACDGMFESRPPYAKFRDPDVHIRLWKNRIVLCCMLSALFVFCDVFFIVIMAS